MKWTDSEEIAETLDEQHPDLDLWSLRFTDLRNMVVQLDSFSDNPSNCNEKSSRSYSKLLVGNQE